MSWSAAATSSLSDFSDVSACSALSAWSALPVWSAFSAACSALPASPDLEDVPEPFFLPRRFLCFPPGSPWPWPVTLPTMKLKKRTTKPVKTAEAMVPSRTPTMVPRPMKLMHMAMTTMLESQSTLMEPKLLRER